MNNIQFSEYSDEHEEAFDEEMRRVGSSRKAIKLEPGRTQLRLCPVPKDWGPVMLITHVHWLDFGNKKWISFCCPRQMANKPCPQCEEMDRLEKAPNAEDADEAWRMRPNLTVVTNAICRSDGASAGPRVLKYGPTVQQAINAVKKEFGDPWHVRDGYDIVVTIDEGKTQRDAKIMPARQAKKTPLDPDGDWTQQLKRLERLAEVPSYDDCIAMMNGEDPRRRKPQLRPGQRPPARQLKAPPTGRTVADVDDDEDEDD